MQSVSTIEKKRKRYVGVRTWIASIQTVMLQNALQPHHLHLLHVEETRIVEQVQCVSTIEKKRRRYVGVRTWSASIQTVVLQNALQPHHLHLLHVEETRIVEQVQCVSTIE